MKKIIFSFIATFLLSINLFSYETENKCQNTDNLSQYIVFFVSEITETEIDPIFTEIDAYSLNIKTSMQYYKALSDSIHKECQLTTFLKKEVNQKIRKYLQLRYKKVVVDQDGQEHTLYAHPSSDDLSKFVFKSFIK